MKRYLCDYCGILHIDDRTEEGRFMCSAVIGLRGKLPADDGREPWEVCPMFEARREGQPMTRPSTFYMMEGE